MLSYHFPIPPYSIVKHKHSKATFHFPDDVICKRSLTSFQAVLLFCIYNRFYVFLASSYHREDLAIVLDSSTSIKQDVYESSIGFIYDLVDYMSISPSTTRLALITFASKATLEFSFEKCVNRECIHKKLSSLLKR